MIRHYWESLFNDNLTFILGWEAFVFMMLLFFISIVVRLARIERKLDDFFRY
jgi:hypothetical protein